MLAWKFRWAQENSIRNVLFYVCAKNIASLFLRYHFTPTHLPRTEFYFGFRWICMNVSDYQGECRTIGHIRQIRQKMCVFQFPIQNRTHWQNRAIGGDGVTYKYRNRIAASLFHLPSHGGNKLPFSAKTSINIKSNKAARGCTFQSFIFTPFWKWNCPSYYNQPIIPPNGIHGFHLDKDYRIS